MVPAIILEDNTTSEMESNLSLDALQSEEKSRRFSQLPPGLSMSFYPDFYLNFTLSLSKSYPDIAELFVFISLLTTPSNVLPLHLKQAFPSII